MATLVHYTATLVARKKSDAGNPIPTVLVDQLNKSGNVSVPAVAINIATFAALGAATLIGFNILRPNNKIVYQPKVKYAEDGKEPPKVSEGFFGWVSPVLRYKEADLLPLIGLDAITFLRFTRMMRYMLTTLAIVMSVVLMPIDIAYNVRNNTNNSKTDLSILTMADVYGSSVWAHVAMSYIGTMIALGFIWYNYKEMVRLRWAYFRSDEYQKSFHARTLMITNVAKRLQSDPALAAVLSEIKMPYPTTEVHIGRRVGALPDLIEKHSDLVRALERVLAKYLKDPNKLPAKRPTVRVGGFCGCMGGQTVDAIDHYTNQINKVEAAIEDWRERIAEKKPESYGFASLAAVPYAHAAAKSLKNKHPRGLTIILSPPPGGIIWKNLTLSKGERFRSSTWGLFLLIVLIFFNTFPLLVISLVSNMAAFTGLLPFLQKWQDVSSWSFAAVAGLAPPLISALAGYLMPVLMRRIAKYRGVKTRQKLDKVIIGQYFGFLVISQFIIFSLIGVALTTIGILVADIKQHKSASEILDSLGSYTAYAIKRQYFNQSNYWLTWIPLRGFLYIFDLAQVLKLLLVWFQKGIFGRTPRDVREYTKPPVFEYSVYYANLLFLTSVAMFYTCLAPLIVAFAAAAFWLSSFVYKYQLMYVFTTKHESGGLLWRVVVNRLLVTIVFMQILLALAVALDVAYVQTVASVPPILMVIGFKIYCRNAFDKKFDWYIPTDSEIAKSHVHSGDARHNRLQRRFGHPALHQRLFTPMVHAKVKHLLPQVYHGRIEQGVANIDGRKVETEEVMGGLKIAAIEEDQLEYDPTNDSDARSIMSGTTMGGFNTVGAGTPMSGMTGGGDYFKSQYANYIAGGAQRGEEIEMGNVAARDSRDNLLEKNLSLYSDSAEGTLVGPGAHGRKPSNDMYRTYTEQSGPMTPGFEYPLQHATQFDPYGNNVGTPGSYLPPIAHEHGPIQTTTGPYGAASQGQHYHGGMTPRYQLQQLPPQSQARPGVPSRQNSEFSPPLSEAQSYSFPPQQQPVTYPAGGYMSPQQGGPQQPPRGPNQGYPGQPPRGPWQPPSGRG
ncbi:DUF221-domain-containing protein [Violaceomyces palustris]|uniref:DUF221-domain-containing protein n=1 Tax=Violaceomyces palustris TaxID=1673888 RepID=A0ACD0NRQ3_9BASI|nr:DUF221-domain-containing protein [Violaceomyces palustris]